MFTANPHDYDDHAERDRLNVTLLRMAGDLVDSSDRDAVLQRLCSALLAASPHILLAWIWIGPTHARVIEPQVWAGPAGAYAETLRIQHNWLTRKGPVFQALFGEDVAHMRVSHLSLFGPWRRAAAQHGFGEAIALRLPVQDPAQAGVVVFYADDPQYFERIGLAPFAAFVRVAASMIAQCERVRTLRDLAATDALTGLLNRRGMQDALAHATERALCGGAPFALVLMDLDRFKLINDSYGHPAGDAVLVHATAVLRQVVRDQDVVARWGGEEFLILLEGADEDAAVQTAERLRRTLRERPALHEGRAIPLTASFGVLGWSGPHDDLDRLLAQLDSLLYDAKRAGRDCVRFPGDGESRVISLGARIQRAIENDRIRAAYQSLVDLRDEGVVGYEALARIVCEDGQVMPAGQFIQAAHRLRLEHRIDTAVISQALRHCAHAQMAGQAIKHLINCSADFLTREDCVRTLLAHARTLCPDCASADGPKPVIIEITERQMLHSPRSTLERLAPLLEFGFELAVDDFGSGYSSFLYLLDLPVRYLKIEMELVQRAVADPHALAMVRSIRALAQDLGIRTIAEGIETQQQRDLMRDVGIDWGQGYLWGRPQVDLPARAIEPHAAVQGSQAHGR